MVGVSPWLCQANIIVESPLGHPHSKDSFIMPIMNGYFKHAQLCCSLAWLRSRSQHFFLIFFSLYNLNTDTHTHRHTRTLAISCLCCCMVLGELWGGGNGSKQLLGTKSRLESIKLIVKLLIFSVDALQFICC